MSRLMIDQTPLPGLLVISPARHADARGFFAELWNRRRFAAAGIDIDFVQDNHSLSRRPGTLRGLHYQAPPHAQDKLVQCMRGRILDVAVDARRGSPTYGRWFAVELSAADGRQLLVPKGFLHGFLTREEDTEVLYKCSDYYAPECEGAVRWDSCGIDWGIERPAVLSERDASAEPFAAFDSPFVWEGPA